MTESFNQQVMRVLNDMVRDGEVVTRKSENGHTLYAIAEKKPAKSERKYCQATRKSAAAKAWATRKKNAVSIRQRNAARKAWITRRAQNSALLQG